ncbi:MAG: carboxypeptidase-like regulatory domain-containing protein [Dehalococcoidia bacterium]
MPDRFDERWLDVLRAHADAAEQARMDDRLAGDPAAAAAFESWRRLAASVHESADRRSGPLPSLAPVLDAIRTPASAGGGATPHDILGRATLRRLAAQPTPSAPRPVPGWVIPAAAAAAAVIMALWPTPRGPLGGVFMSAIRQRAPLARVEVPAEPTAVARIGDPAAALRSAAGEPRTGGIVQAARAHRRGARRARGGHRRRAAVRRFGRRRRGRLVRRWSRIARGRALAALGAPGEPDRTIAPPGAGDGAAYPGPTNPTSAYPAPPPAPAGRDRNARKPSKPPIRSPEPATPVPTTTPAPTATPTPAFIGVTGRVTGADGGGRAQVRIAAYRAEDAPVRASWVETFTADASGSYTLPLAAGEWILFVEAPGHRPQWWPGVDRPEAASVVAVGPGGAGIDWRLAAADAGDGLLVGTAGAGALVRAVAEGADATTTSGPSTLADGGGRFALPLPAGRWTVARAGDGRDRDWQELPDAVRIDAGTSTSVSWP